MIDFVNAKINIGLNIVGKRSDGYHLLETVMYPVGLYAGTPSNPVQFCDIMEITVNRQREDMPDNLLNVNYRFTGNLIDCPLGKNLVVKGIKAFLSRAIELSSDISSKIATVDVILDKHLPDGAGMGGGSADAVFAMKLLRKVLHEMNLNVPDTEEIMRLAESIGADCPFFVDNRPALAQGIGEKLTPIGEILSGKWLLVVKPDLSISTKDAFAGVTPHTPAIPLPDAITRPIKEWKNLIHNDFEDSLFPKYPELKMLKNAIYDMGAEYASLTGSGSALYGVYSNQEEAERACDKISVHYSSVLKL